MCGITAYAGREPARELLLEGLERLEYRGYDSAGIALQAGGRLETTRAVGPLRALRDAVGTTAAECGIGHTRWATHGRVTEANAHPHGDADGRVSIVLNGIVENFAPLRERLAADGVAFSSETDAEVVAHLVGRAGGPIEDALRVTVAQLEGHFTIVAMSADEPGVLAGTRRETPLLVGRAEHGTFLASALPAFTAHTRAVQHVEDGEIVRIDAGGAVLTDAAGRPVERPVEEADGDAGLADRGAYDTFMLKEIHEQPRALGDTLEGRLRPDGEIELGAGVEDLLDGVRRVVLLGCGTSHHAGLAGRLALERWARLPVEAEVASEWRARDPLAGPDDLVIGMTQSGETADTLAGMRLARERGARVLAVTNVMGSQATRDADAVLATRAGLEVGVAATKTFTCQVAVLLLLAIRLGLRRGTLAADEAARLAGDIGGAPAALEHVIAHSGPAAERLALRHARAGFFLFLGRHAGLPVALEGALKLKEITYVPADAHAAGEMKHGPIALLGEGTPVVCVATASPVLDKLVSNVQEVRARGAEVAAVTTAGEGVVAEHADQAIAVPRTDPFVQPLLAAVPLQLLAYHVARARGLDVDRPRNLAKTVTVE